MLEEFVVHPEGREEVTPRIAVSLRVERPGIILVDEPVGVLVVDVVVDGVGGFTEPLREIPEHAVEDRIALTEIRAPQERELLVHQAGFEILEGMGVGGDVGESAVVGDRDG